MEDKQSASLERRSAVATLLQDIDDNTLLVASVGTPTLDVAAASERPQNFYVRGAMGTASSVALGLALAQGEKRVIAVLGDAELLMTAGTLATIAVMAPENLSLVVIDNERYGETGLQIAATAFGVDIAGMAAAAGLSPTAVIRTEADLHGALDAIRMGPGPSLHVIKVRPEKPEKVPLPYDGVYLKNRFRRALFGDEGIT